MLIYSDRIDDANALIKEKDQIIMEEKGKTSENVSQLINAFSKSWIVQCQTTPVILTQTPATVTVTVTIVTTKTLATRIEHSTILRSIKDMYVKLFD